MSFPAQAAPLRIWHVDLGGQERAVSGVAHAIERLDVLQRQMGADVEVFTAPPSQALAQARVLARRARREHPDVVHLHSVFRPAHAWLARALTRAGVAYVTSPHSGLAAAGLTRDRFRKLLYLRLFEAPLLRGADAVFCLTPTEAKEVHASVPGTVHTVVVANPVDLDAAVLTWRPENVRPKLVCLARFDSWQKGLDRLSALVRVLPEVDVVVHGKTDGKNSTDFDSLLEHAPENLTFAPPRTGEAKGQLLAHADAYIQLSRWEGLSLSVLEAMAAGVPVLVSDYIFDSMELNAAMALRLDTETSAGVAAAAAAVQALLADRPRMARMSRAGALYARTAYDPQVVVQTMVDTYARVARR